MDATWKNLEYFDAYGPSEQAKVFFLSSIHTLPPLTAISTTSVISIQSQTHHTTSKKATMVTPLHRRAYYTHQQKWKQWQS